MTMKIHSLNLSTVLFFILFGLFIFSTGFFSSQKAYINETDSKNDLKLSKSEEDKINRSVSLGSEKTDDSPEQLKSYPTVEYPEIIEVGEWIEVEQFENSIDSDLVEIGPFIDVDSQMYEVSYDSNNEVIEVGEFIDADNSLASINFMDDSEEINVGIILDVDDYSSQNMSEGPKTPVNIGVFIPIEDESDIGFF